MAAKIHDKSSMWLKAKVLRSGALGPVSRARVSDLLSLDMDRPAGPSQLHCRILFIVVEFVHLRTVNIDREL